VDEGEIETVDDRVKLPVLFC